MSWEAVGKMKWKPKDSIKAKLCAILVIFFSQSGFAEPTVGLLYPDIREPFRTIFKTIVSGAEEGLSANLQEFKVVKGHEKADLERWVEKEKIDALIALGVSGQRAALALDQQIPVVLGALLSVDESGLPYDGVALTPSPGQLFELLKEITPAVKHVNVVYNPKNYQWLIDYAESKANSLGLELITHKALDLKESANLYKKLLAGQDPQRDALWLLQDPSTVDSKVVLPFILEQAWHKNLIVFSSALGHAKKGVLFSMYPDNMQHGKQLATLLLDNLSRADKTEKQVLPSAGVLRAINTRTAEHIGLRFSPADLKEYDVVFPLSN